MRKIDFEKFARRLPITGRMICAEFNIHPDHEQLCKEAFLKLLVASLELMYISGTHEQLVDKSISKLSSENEYFLANIGRISRMCYDAEILLQKLVEQKPTKCSLKYSLLIQSARAMLERRGVILKKRKTNANT